MRRGFKEAAKQLALEVRVARVEDTRAGLDLAVRFVVSWVLVASATFLLLWPYGSWVLISLLAYGMAWISYRGACHAAIEYGLAVWVLIDPIKVWSATSLLRRSITRIWPNVGPRFPESPDAKSTEH